MEGEERMKILLASPIDPHTVDVLSESHDVVKPAAATPEALKAAIADRNAVVLRSGVMLSAEVLAAAPGLELLVRAGAGLDNIDLDQARAQGLRVVKIPGMSAPPVAEFTFALLLSLARKVTVADRALREGHWPKPTLGGPLLHGKTLGIIGAGNIGALVGQMGAAWGMRAIGCVANPNDTIAQQLLGRGVRLTDFDEVLTTSDFLCLHTPLDESTRHLIGSEALARMKPGSLLVNVARGGVVDEAALLEALTRGDTVAGAALDVHEIEGEGTRSRFTDLDNVVLTPHIGAMAVDSQRLIGERIVELVQAHDNGKLDEEIRDGEHVL
jgi:D-3-phosphoglycerate dehydrogenase / 2-oxoglutarate reductase